MNVKALIFKVASLTVLYSCAAVAGASSRFTVAGVVLNDIDSTPIAGAFVVVEPEGESRSQFEASGVRTGPDGRFVIANVSAPQYRIMAEKAGFLRALRNFQRTDRNPPAPSAESAPNDPIELRMVPQAVIAGRVIDSAGQPIANATVQLSRMRLQGRGTVLSPVAQIGTNDLGEYRLFNLEPGRYYVGAWYQDQGSRLGLRQRPAENGASAVIMEDYAVTYYPGSLEPESATPVRLRAGQVANNIDLQVAMARAFPVTGVVTGLPQGAQMPQVFLQLSQPGGLGAFRVYSPAPGAGAFRFNSVAPGTYVLRTNFNAGGQSLSAREEVVVGSAPVTDVVLDLRPPFSIKGVVLADGGGAVPATVKLRLTGLERHLPAPIEPDAQGRFETPVGGPDSYAVDAIDGSGTAYIKSVEIDGQAVGGNGISIQSSNHLLRIVVSDKGGRIEGTAVNSEQHPLKSGLVVLVGLDPQDSRSDAVALSSEGKFEIKSLPPGKYHIGCFSDLALPGDATWDVQKKVRTSGQEISVSERDQQQVTLEAIQADPS